MDFWAATDVEFRDGELHAHIDEDWCIWGPVGGYLASIALRATAQVAPASHHPVTLSCQFISKGSPGDAKVSVKTRKEGLSSLFSVEISQHDKALMSAQIWTTDRHHHLSKVEAIMPEVPAPEEIVKFADQLVEFGQEVLPYWRNVDHRQVDFLPPGTSDPAGSRIRRWMSFLNWESHREESSFCDAMRAVLAIDTHFFAAHNRGLTERPDYVAPTLDLTVWFHDFALAEEWLLVDARADVAHRSLLSGYARVWSQRGKLLASGGSQCLIRPLRTE